MSNDLTVNQDKATEHGENGRVAHPHVPLDDRVSPAIDGRGGKRKRTGGETLFDLTTYGGFALVGNEVVSTYIVKQAEKPTAFGRLYQRAGELTKKISPKGGLPFVSSGRFNYINFAIIGGFTMVPFIKFFEDNKGRLVRAADSIIHGVKADNDPEIRRAHEEMDNAPKQTWGSLLKGRIATVVFAWLVDASINWKGGWSARALKGTKLENYSSLESIAGRAADRMADSIGSRRGLDVAKTANLKSWLNQGFGLLSLSTALTVLFYISSKVFAKRSDDRREIYDEIHRPHTTDTTGTNETPSVHTKPHHEYADAIDAPSTAVHSIAHDARLNATPNVGKEA